MPLGYPEMPRSFVNSFANSNVLATSTAGSVAGGPNGTSSPGSTAPTRGGVSFGFAAALVKVTVDAGIAYLNYKSTDLATTDDYKLTTGDATQDFYCFGAGVSGMCFAATSTALIARVGAWG